MKAAWLLPLVLLTGCPSSTPVVPPPPLTYTVTATWTSVDTGSGFVLTDQTTGNIIASGDISSPYSWQVTTLGIDGQTISVAVIGPNGPGPATTAVVTEVPTPAIK